MEKGRIYPPAAVCQVTNIHQAAANMLMLICRANVRKYVKFILILNHLVITLVLFRIHIICLTLFPMAGGGIHPHPP